jgi:beta-lactamase superfamily II metal-dependent hydrolase
MKYKAPESNELEIILIGTGGGYGESALIHLGNNEWVIIDSCINPHSDYPLPLEYLNKIGVNVAVAVKLIICTHWHDDHIQGISTILEFASSAKFCMAKVNDKQKFLQFVSLDYQKLEKIASNTSTQEFNKCLKLIKNRSIGFKHASADKILLSKSYHGKVIELISLSPSDQAVDRFDAEISSLITEFGETRKKIVVDDPNDKSVVILIKAGNHRALLGADLEVTQEDNTGWNDIVNNSQCLEGKVTYFKIPHHGSENGYHPKIWAKLIDPNSISSLTPWNRNNKLPDPNMLKVYCHHSRNLFMTSPITSNKPKKRDKEIEKIIQSLNYKLSEVKFSQGCICSKINLVDDTATWHNTLIDAAFHVNLTIND